MMVMIGSQHNRRRGSKQHLLTGNSPGDPDRVGAMFAVLWRFGEADVSVFVDPALIDKEVLVDLHNSCKNKQADTQKI